MIKRRVAKFVSPLVVGVCVCATLSAATTRSAPPADPLCEETFTGFAVGLPSVPRSNGRPGPGRIDLHNEAVQEHVQRGGRVMVLSDLGEGSENPDRFGAAVALADLDGDYCLDVVVGAPGVDGGGAVYVIYGTPAGLGTGAWMRIPYQPSPGDAFGEAVAVEPPGPQTNQRHFPRIWIGAPGTDVSGQADAGAVVYTEVVDRVASTPRPYNQDSPGVPGQSEPGDRFGEQLAALHSDVDGGGGGVLVGQPSEDIGVRKDAGMVTVLPTPGAVPAGPGPYSVTQDTPGIPGTAEAGDRFGAAVDAYGGVGWVGVPYEDVGAVRDAGMVHGLRIGATQVTSLTDLHQGQDKGGTIPGRPEAGDHLGASVLARQLQDQGSKCNEAQVIIGVPGEDVGTTKDAGEADSYFGRDRDVRNCLPGTAFNLGAKAHPGDRLGAAVGRKRFSSFLGSDELLIGIPGNDVATAVDAGVVVSRTSPGTTRPLAYPAVYTQSDGAVSGAHYGAVLNR